MQQEIDLLIENVRKLTQIVGSITVEEYWTLRDVGEKIKTAKPSEIKAWLKRNDIYPVANTKAKTQRGHKLKYLKSQVIAAMRNEAKAGKELAMQEQIAALKAAGIDPSQVDVGQIRNI
ncbi:MAG: hypothetical protein HRU12_09690 [Phaeodactylibacter sp.]|nr:hypothetical protein [Phaeodactylibacter sp.]